MENTNRRSLLRMLGAVPFAGALAARPQKGGVETPVDPSRERTRERYFPNVELRTHENKKVRFYDDLIKNKIVTINFMYAKCEGVCPGVTANLVKVQKLLGDRVGRDIRMYSISLKPEQDTPKVLKEYAKAYHTRPGWEFLTGRPEDIEMLRQRLGFTDPDPQRDKDKANHIGNVRYGNEALQLWAACPGMANSQWIAESISWVDWPVKQS